jgi:nitrogen fixation-related uncharacterized protein
MEVVVLLVFVSLVLVSCSIYAFIATVQAGDHEHIDRLALAPLAGDAPAPARRNP